MLAVDGIAHRSAVDLTTKRNLPQQCSRASVEREEVTFAAAAENDVTCSGENSSPGNVIHLELPLLIESSGIECTDDVTDNNTDFWLLAAPTMQDVTVNGGTVTLPFLRTLRTKTIQGDPGVQLQSYLSETVTVPPETLASSESKSFTLPPQQKGDTSDGGVISAGPAQPPIAGSVITKAPGAVVRQAGVTSEYFEFDVDAVHDNAAMRGHVTPTLPADLDLYLQRQAPDGSWSDAGTRRTS